MEATLSWREGSEVQVTTVAELDRELNRLAGRGSASKPFVVDVTLNNGDTLSIGLGREVTVLNFMQGSEEPPYYTSEGDGRSTKSVVFFYFGSYSEFSAKSLISIATGRNVMREFMRTGKLSSAIGWRME